MLNIVSCFQKYARVDSMDEYCPSPLPVAAHILNFVFDTLT